MSAGGFLKYFIGAVEVKDMDYVGIDIGSTASKVVARGKKEIEFVLPTGWSSKETTQTIKTRLLEDGVDVLAEDTKVVATGYGRVAVDFADYVITEITCHARGGREMAGDNCSIKIGRASCRERGSAVV